jgi:hypothetical protein
MPFVDRGERLGVVLSLARVAGGAALLRVLGAPAWAVAAWVMLSVRVKLGQRRARRSPYQPRSDRGSL